MRPAGTPNNLPKGHTCPDPEASEEEETLVAPKQTTAVVPVVNTPPVLAEDCAAPKLPTLFPSFEGWKQDSRRENSGTPYQYPKATPSYDNPLIGFTNQGGRVEFKFHCGNSNASIGA